MSTLKVKVIVYPLASNPYQSLLYDHFPNNENYSFKFIQGPSSTIGFMLHLEKLIILLTIYRVRGYKILHLHWLYALRFPGNSIAPRISSALSKLEIYIFLAVTKILNFKLVWTVHDLNQHNKQITNEYKVIQRLIIQSSKLILLSSVTIDEMTRLRFVYDNRKISIIPLGNYIGFYPNFINKNLARRTLGIPANAFVYLYFGNIEHYKNVPGLIRAFVGISEEDSSAYLIIAGKPRNATIMNELLQLKDFKNKKIILKLKYIPDEYIQLYYNASDIAVHPFLEITNSSSILLSASFGKGIIAPRIGSLRTLPANIGFYYNQNNEKSLADTMKRARRNKDLLVKKSNKIKKYALSFNWNEISSNTMQVYRGVLARKEKENN